MSLNGKQLYKFGQFTYDTRDDVLRRGDIPVSLTPKMFELLNVLLTNHGRIVSKDELMKTVWAGSIVEEGNLTYTIRQLRKALHDDAHKPTYIETIARRGYRFIAEVELISGTNGSPAAARLSAESPEAEKVASRVSPLAIATMSSLAVVLVIAAGWFVQTRTPETNVPVLAAPFATEKLSTNGKVAHVAVSPDGKNVVYTNEINDKQSVWLRQVESSNNVELIPPSEDVYGGLEFSPDGNLVYFTRRPQNVDGQLDIYKVSVFGGVPSKLIGETQGWISVSPDGEKISFVRCYYNDDDYCSLWLADAADGENETRLIVRQRPIRITDNQISPDGRSITFAAGQSENQANDFGLSEVDIATRAEREVTPEKFFNIKALAWLPDKSGLLVTASRIPNNTYRIWRLSSATGEAEALTKDSESYVGLSLDRNATTLVSTQVRVDFRLLHFQMDKPAAGRFLADGRTISFTHDGKVVFSSAMSGYDEIWSTNADGSGQRQLTNDAADDSRPIVSHDNATIFFCSNRTGEVQIWRMNSDGSAQSQVTKMEGGFPVFASPDGRWVYYQHGVNRSLWRVPAAGGEEELVLDEQNYRFALSPDGSRVAYSGGRGKERILTILSLDDKRVAGAFTIGNPTARLREIEWLPDGTSVAYTLADNDDGNNTLWIQPLDGRAADQIAELGDKDITSLAFAPDGKSFVVAEGVWKHDAVLLRGLK